MRINEKIFAAFVLDRYASSSEDGQGRVCISFATTEKKYRYWVKKFIKNGIFSPDSDCFSGGVYIVLPKGKETLSLLKLRKIAEE